MGQKSKLKTQKWSYGVSLELCLDTINFGENMFYKHNKSISKPKYVLL